MIYKIINKITGISRVDTFSEIDIEYDIKDFCFVPDFGFFYIADNCIGCVDLKGKNSFPIVGQEGVSLSKKGFARNALLDRPTSICYNEDSKRLLISEKNGENIVSVNLADEFYTSTLLDTTVKEKIQSLYNKTIDNKNTHISYCNNLVCWSSEGANRVFVLKGTSELYVFGDGRKAYATSMSFGNNSFNSPTGIAAYKEGFYVADCGNKCIRMFDFTKNNIAYGNPLGEEIEIGKMLFFKNYIYYIGRNSVFYLLLSVGNPCLAYSPNSSEKVISITKNTMDKQEKLSVLIKEMNPRG